DVLYMNFLLQFLFAVLTFAPPAIIAISFLENKGVNSSEKIRSIMILISILILSTLLYVITFLHFYSIILLPLMLIVFILLVMIIILFLRSVSKAITKREIIVLISLSLLPALMSVSFFIFGYSHFFSLNFWIRGLFGIRVVDGWWIGLELISLSWYSILIFLIALSIRRKKIKKAQEAEIVKKWSRLQNFGAHCDNCDFLRFEESGRMFCHKGKANHPQYNVCKLFIGPLDKYLCPGCSEGGKKFSKAYFGKPSAAHAGMSDELELFECEKCSKKSKWTEFEL
ncbi:MAG: hypothetical protein FWC67_05255, partial [Defluviitaleaceae bacterium]|nr:hypothetical protein [Defluviitaleaceae bacterium]